MLHKDFKVKCQLIGVYQGVFLMITALLSIIIVTFSYDTRTFFEHVCTFFYDTRTIFS